FCERIGSMLFFAHHMGVEIFGREFSPQGPVQHLLVFLVLGFIAATSAYGTWCLAARLIERVRQPKKLDGTLGEVGPRGAPGATRYEPWPTRGRRPPRRSASRRVRSR